MTECHCGKDGHALNSINCPVHGTWRDIETAPQDGTIVLVCGPYDEPHIAAFRKRRYGHFGWIAMGCNGAAIESQDDFGTEYQEPGPLTHWMPLPERPST